MLLAALFLVLAASLQCVVGQLGSSPSTAILLSSGAQYRGVIDSSLSQPTYNYFNFSIASSDPALSSTATIGSDLMFFVEALGGADPTFLGLIVTDPAGNVYADETRIGFEVASVQITSDTAVLSTGQALMAGNYVVQVVGETANQYYPGGSNYYQLTAQLQQRTLLTTGTPTVLTLPAAFNGTFPAGTIAHADYSATSSPFYIIVTTAAYYNATAAISPWVVWEQGSDNMDVAIDEVLNFDYNFIFGPYKPYNYQLYWYAGDSTCAPSCYLHFLALSQTTVTSPAITIQPTTGTEAITTVASGAAASFTGTALSVMYFSFSITQSQVIAQLSLSGSGIADMYVAPAAVATQYVDQTTAYWSATAYTTPNNITITPTDPYFFSNQDQNKPGRQSAMNGQYFLTVFVLQAGTFSLQLTVTNAVGNTAATTLPLALNSTGTASDFLSSVTPIKYYTFTVPDTLNTNVSDLVLSLNTTCSDLYLSDVTTQPNPASPASSAYSSTQAASDVIVLTGQYGELHSGQYWVGVSLSNTSVSSCPFILSVSFDVRSTVVFNTQLRQGPLPAGTIRYYDIFVPNGYSIDFRAIVTTPATPVSIFATQNYMIYGSRPQYPDPSPFDDTTYEFSISSNGSDPVVSLLALATRSVLFLPTYCQGPQGCVQTLAVFSPFGTGGIPTFLLEVEPFFTNTLTTLNDSVAVVASRAVRAVPGPELHTGQQQRHLHHSAQPAVVGSERRLTERGAVCGTQPWRGVDIRQRAH